MLHQAKGEPNPTLLNIAMFQEQGFRNPEIIRNAKRKSAQCTCDDDKTRHILVSRENPKRLVCVARNCIIHKYGGRGQNEE